jgi:hypothetical protein
LPEKILELGYVSFRDEARERLRMQETLAQTCFRSLVLVNGGAIIALFSLIGSNAAIARELSGLQLWLAFAAFAAGLTATIVANLSGFFMQLHYASMTERQMWNKELELAGRAPAYDFEACLIAGDRWEKVAIMSVALSLIFFGVGASLCILTFLS